MDEILEGLYFENRLAAVRAAARAHAVRLLPGADPFLPGEASGEVAW